MQLLNINIWTKSPLPGLLDLVIIGVYLILIFFWARIITQKRIDENPAYEFFQMGLFAKIFGAIALGIVYTFFYGVQDTLGFYISSEALVNVLFENPGGYFRLMMGDMSPEAFSAFNYRTGYPWYRNDPSGFFVVRITSIFTILGFKNYFTTSILFSCFFFKGFWKLYLMITDIFPNYRKEFAFAVFFFPSVMFWSSGILKDTVTLSMTGWFLYSFYWLVLKRKNTIKNLFWLLISGFCVLAIKPYVLVALIPGAFIYLAWNYLGKVNNVLLRIFLAPALTMIFLISGLFLLSLFKPALGDYGTIDGIIQKAIITYEDHTRAVQYGENFYSLGKFDGTLENFLSKAPGAITAGLFRPFIWEAKNPFVLLAALENLGLFFLICLILWRTGLVKTIEISFNTPLIVFSLSFALFFAFAVGVSTANFGALVRLKTPMLPFLATALLALYRRSAEIKNEKENNNARALVMKNV